VVKREMTPPSQQQQHLGQAPQPHDLNSMISMYLPGDAASAAAAAAAAGADSRLHSMYAGHYQAMMGQRQAQAHAQSLAQSSALQSSSSEHLVHPIHM
jgi:hypothetical protein